MQRILVVPSCRELHLLQFLDRWGGWGGWDHVILIEDNPDKTFILDTRAGIAPIYHFTHKDIHEALGEDSWIISKRDSAIRCFGFLVAYHLGASHVLTLDDDTYPIPPETYPLNAAYQQPLFDHHLLCLKHRRWTCSPFWNIRTRGLPYQNLGEMDVQANVGLWTNVGDWDAVQTLSGAGATHFQPAPGNRLIPRGQYVPVCGMNLCIMREALPCFYFPLMGANQPFARFDDIWAGVIAKKVFDHLGWHLAVGEPFVEHRRASDPFVNLVKEAPGIAFNETFWEVIDRIPLPTGLDAVELMAFLGSQLRSQEHFYLTMLGKALETWAGLFRAVPEGLRRLLSL